MELVVSKCAGGHCFWLQSRSNAHLSQVRAMLRRFFQALSVEDKIKVLIEKICRSGEEPAAALLVLMTTLENATHPNVLANKVKHLAFTRCGELNLCDMVDAQIAAFEGNLFAKVQ